MRKRMKDWTAMREPYLREAVSAIAHRRRLD